jgi:superfamily I DNA/RNA helicase
MKEGPVSALLKGGDYLHGAVAIQEVTMKAIKGLEFFVVELPGVENMPSTWGG